MEEMFSHLPLFFSLYYLVQTRAEDGVENRQSRQGFSFLPLRRRKGESSSGRRRIPAKAEELPSFFPSFFFARGLSRGDGTIQGQTVAFPLLFLRLRLHPADAQENDC